MEEKKEGLFNLQTVDESTMIEVDDIENPEGKGSLKNDDEGKSDEEKVDDEIILDDEGNVTMQPAKTGDENVLDDKEKKKVEKKEDKESAGDETDNKVTPKNFSPFAIAVREAGIIPTLDLEKMAAIEDPEEQAQFMVDSMEEYIEAKILEEAGNVSPDVEFLLKNYRKGVPLKDILDVQEFNFNLNSIKDADVKKEDNKDLRAAIMKEYYRLTAPSMKKEKVEKIIADSQLTGDDVDEAVSYLGEMKEMGKKEEVNMLARAEEKTKEDTVKYNKWKTDVKELIDKTEDIIPGVKLTKKQLDTVYNNMIRPVAYKELDNGRKIPMSRAMQVREEDPNLFDIRLNALMEAGYFSKTVDKGKILSKQKTAALSDLSKSLEDGRELNTAKKTIKEKNNDEEKKTFFTSLNLAAKNKL